MSKKLIETEKRRLNVKKLRRMGFSNSLISEKLNVGIRTVEHDVAWWREKHTELCRNIFLPSLIGETVSTYSEIEGLALSRADENTTISDLPKLLSVALKVKSEMVGFLFRLGTQYADTKKEEKDEYDVTSMGVEELEFTKKCRHSLLSDVI